MRRALQAIRIAGLGLVAVWLTACSSSNSGPHGNPDPGGTRFALLTRLTHRVVPEGASGVRLELRKSHWDPGGCDGGAAGWSRMEVEQVFRASGNVPGELDSAMRKQHWRLVPVQGGSAIRQYKPVKDRSIGGFAWLIPESDATGRTWHLILSAAPAEVPTHAC